MRHLFILLIVISMFFISCENEKSTNKDIKLKTISTFYEKSNDNLSKAINNIFDNYLNKINKQGTSNIEIIKQKLIQITKEKDYSEITNICDLALSIDNKNENITNLCRDKYIEFAEIYKKRNAYSDKKHTFIYFLKALILSGKNDEILDKTKKTLDRFLKKASVKEYIEALSFIKKGFLNWDKADYLGAFIEFEKAYTKCLYEDSIIYNLTKHRRDFQQLKNAESFFVMLEKDKTKDPLIIHNANKMKTAMNVLNQFKNKEAKTEYEKTVVAKAQITLGNIKDGIKMIKDLQKDFNNPSIVLKFYEAFAYNKRSYYNDASKVLREIIDFIKKSIKSKHERFNFFIYKTQIEDFNSLEVIALKWRTNKSLIRACNPIQHKGYVETNTLLIIPKLKQNQTMNIPVKNSIVTNMFGYVIDSKTNDFVFNKYIDFENYIKTKCYPISKGKVKIEKDSNTLKIIHEKIISIYLNNSEINKEINNNQLIDVSDFCKYTDYSDERAMKYLSLGIQNKDDEIKYYNPIIYF